MVKCYMEFGEYLKNVRKNKNLSLRELSSLTGISHPYLSQLENGKNKRPTPDILKKLSDGMSIPYIGLLEKAGYITPDNNAANDEFNSAWKIIDTFVRELIHEWSSSKEGKRHEIEKIISNYLDTIFAGLSNDEFIKFLDKEMKDYKFDEKDNQYILKIKNYIRILSILDKCNIELRLLSDSRKDSQELISFLKKKNITYHNKIITTSDKKRIEKMLEVLLWNEDSEIQ